MPPEMRAAAAALLVGLTAGCANAAAPEGVVRTEAASFRVVQVAGGLDHPWCLAFLPGGDMLVTERPGRLRLIHDRQLEERAVAGVPEVYTGGQAGLWDVALDPDFAVNGTLYLSYAYPAAGKAGVRVMRARYAPEGLSEQRVILDVVPPVAGRANLGGRLAFLPDKTLLVTTGDRFSERDRAQDLGSLLGKVLRIDRDGGLPPDNPFVHRDGARPEIFTLGHRNPEGLAVDPATGLIWEEEHGAKGGDEVNLLKPGANYGWPQVAYGVNYDGSTIAGGERTRPGIESPVHYWDPSIAPSGLALYTGDRFPGWRGNLLVGALKYQLLSRLELDPAGRVVREERMLKDSLGRVRDVRQGPDGLVYILNDQDRSGLYRLEPAD